MTTTNDLRVADIRPLVPPSTLRRDLPLGERAADLVTAARGAASRVLHGQDDRLIAVVGPCSIHDPGAALEYAARLASHASEFVDALVVVMRVYFEKPRTNVGWKGLINDPGLDGTFEINRGMRIARKLLLDVSDIGVVAATEFVDTITPQFLSDLVSWAAIGARTTESPVHRQLASGLSMPVGFKNGTDGRVQIAVDAILAAKSPHSFLGVTAEGVAAIVNTKGNDDCHVVLRGSNEGPNYAAEHVERAALALESAGLRGRVMIDCSHGNSQKDYTRQLPVAKAVAEQIATGSKRIAGVMIESNLEAGRQDFRAGTAPLFGRSITDACLGWSDTLVALRELAGAVRARRAAR